MKKELIAGAFALGYLFGVTHDSGCTGPTRFFDHDHLAVCETEEGFLAMDREGNQRYLDGLENINRVYFSRYDNKLIYFTTRPYTIEEHEIDLKNNTEELTAYWIPYEGVF